MPTTEKTFESVFKKNSIVKNIKRVLKTAFSEMEPIIFSGIKARIALLKYNKSRARKSRPRGEEPLVAGYLKAYRATAGVIQTYYHVGMCVVKQ